MVIRLVCTLTFGFALFVGCGNASTDDSAEGTIDESADVEALDASSEQLLIHDAWVRSAAEGGTTALYGLIDHRNASEDHLVDASSPVSERTEIHETVEEDGMLGMRELEGGLLLAPEDTTRLRPGGAHIMMYDLDQMLTRGNTIEVTLYFDTHNSITLDVPVRDTPPE